MASITRDSDAAKIAGEVQAIKDAYDLLKGFDSSLQTINSTTPSFADWSDQVQNNLETYYKGLKEGIIKQVNADVPDGTYANVGTTLTKLVTELNSLVQNKKDYEDAKAELARQNQIGQYSYTYTIKDSKNNDVPCAASTPGATEHKTQRQEWYNASVKYSGCDRTVHERVKLVNQAFLELQNYTFGGGTAAPPPAAEAPQEQAPEEEAEEESAAPGTPNYGNPGTMDLLGVYMETDGTYKATGEITYDKDNPANRTFTEGWDDPQKGISSHTTYTYTQNPDGTYSCTITNVLTIDGQESSSSNTYTANADGTITGTNGVSVPTKFVFMTVVQNGQTYEIPFLYQPGYGVASGVGGGFTQGDASYLRGLEGETGLLYHDGPLDVDQYYTGYISQGACDNGQEWPVETGNVLSMRIGASN